MSEQRPSWNFRFLNPGDLDEVKELCRVWFPVRYPEKWFIDITSGNKFYSLAAVDNFDGHILGIIVCDVKPLSQVNREDSYLLASHLCSDEVRVAYILSLGVIESCRRKHLGSELLHKLTEYLTSSVMQQVKAVYLHVLATNSAAIRFYKKHHFQHHEFLPFYYHIADQARDGCSYVLYINGGRPEFTLMEQLRSSLSIVCSVIKRLCTRPTTIVYRLVVRGFAVTAAKFH